MLTAAQRSPKPLVRVRILTPLQPMNNERPWDPEEKYTQGQLKEYTYWNLEVSYRQHTFGNYIIFSKEDVERISELSPEAILELKRVMAEIEQALNKNHIFKPDRYNYWQMGNGLHRLHFHGFPRYKTSRSFFGKEWVDQTWGHPPVWSTEEVSNDEVNQLREVIQASLK